MGERGSRQDACIYADIKYILEWEQCIESSKILCVKNNLFQNLKRVKYPAMHLRGGYDSKYCYDRSHLHACYDLIQLRTLLKLLY